MRRLSEPEWWFYGTFAAAFVVTNVAIAVFALSYWEWVAVFAGVCAAGLAGVWYRTR